VHSTDPYVVLGVTPDATRAEVAHAYRQLVRQHHPDLRDPAAPQDDSSGVALEQVLQAYATLRGAERRAGQHRLRRSGGTPNEPVRLDRAQAPVPHNQPPLRAGPVFWLPDSR
jgi:curved DNA-binding protein CbpA